MSVETSVSTAIDPVLAAAAMEEGPTIVTIGGTTFTLRSPCPMGAFAVFATRLGDKNPVVQAGSWIRLLRAWIVPEEHDAIDTMMESVASLDEFATGELPKLVEAATARPTSAPSSSPTA